MLATCNVQMQQPATSDASCSCMYQQQCSILLYCTLYTCCKPLPAAVAATQSCCCALCRMSMHVGPTKQQAPEDSTPTASSTAAASASIAATPSSQTPSSNATTAASTAASTTDQTPTQSDGGAAAAILQKLVAEPMQAAAQPEALQQPGASSSAEVQTSPAPTDTLPGQAQVTSNSSQPVPAAAAADSSAGQDGGQVIG
jgi:hypothetical protein